MAYLTETDIINLKMVISKANYNQSVSDQELLKKIVIEDEASPTKLEMKDGSNYFKNDSDILKRKIYYWLDERKVHTMPATLS